MVNIESMVVNKPLKKNQEKGKNLIDNYRKLKNDKARIKYVSNLSTKNKNLLYNKMDQEERNYYIKIASDLMEKRFKEVSRNKEILDYLLVRPEKVRYSYLLKKYKDIDLSITVYTIKAIINVMGNSKFSKDDGSSKYNKNSKKYYLTCLDYWNRIWWDTDTGHLSKEAIKNKIFSDYHKNCNKITTIAEIRKYLYKMEINYFKTRYKLNELKIRFNKTATNTETLMKRKKSFLDKYSKSELLKNEWFLFYSDIFGYNFANLELIIYKTVLMDDSAINCLTEEEIQKCLDKAIKLMEKNSNFKNTQLYKEAATVLDNINEFYNNKNE